MWYHQKYNSIDGKNYQLVIANNNKEQKTGIKIRLTLPGVSTI